MKKALILFVLIASMAFAASSSLGHIDGATPVTPGDKAPDEVLVNNVFDYGALANGIACYSPNGWYLANDFETTDAGLIEDYTIWIIDNGAAGSIDSMFYDGDASGPGSLIDVIGGTGTLTDTGFDEWGFDLYECAVVMDTAYAITASTYYWMTFDPVGGFYYWLTPDYDGTWGSEAYWSADGGYSWVTSTSEFGTPYDNFWTMESIAAVDETTWGAIKAL